MSLIKDSKIRQKLLEDNITPDAESDTVYVANWALHAIQVINPNGATVQIFKSLDDPDDSDVVQNWVQHGDDITENAYISLTEIIRWIKVVRDDSVNPVSVILQSGARSIT